MSQDLVKALGVTPAEKKASELALEYICSDQVNVDDSFTDHKDSFIAGFKAALELAEVKGLEGALKSIRHSVVGHRGNGEILIEIDQALTAWRSFRGEK